MDEKMDMDIATELERSSSSSMGVSSSRATTDIYCERPVDFALLFECSICINIICEPVTTCCGHSFCKMCIVKCLRKSKKKCPSCRSVCEMSAEEAPVNSMIKSLVASIFPKIYAERLLEHEEEKKSWDTVSPIFFYSDPRFPNGNLQVHVFEPRYRIMAQRIVNSSRSFAYVPNLSTYTADVTANVGDVALRASVNEVEFDPEGRCMMKVKLGGRFKIVEHYVEEGTYGLHYCRMEPFSDDPVSSSEEAEQIEQLMVAAKQLCVERLVGEIKTKVESYHGLPPSEPEAFSLWLCGVCFNNAKLKMDMLQCQSTLTRLRLGMESLRILIRRIDNCPKYKSCNGASSGSSGASTSISNS